MGRVVFYLKRFVLEPSWQLFSMGMAMQMHYERSRGYSGVEVEEERTFLVPVSPGLLGPGSQKSQSREVVPSVF